MQIQTVYVFCRFFVFIYCCLFFSNDLKAQNISPLPPTHVRGYQVANQYPSQTDLINVITWNPPKSDLALASYQIYQNSSLTELEATIPANHEKLKFKVHNRKPKHDYTYFLVSVDAAGNKSVPVIIVFHGSKVRVKKKELIAIDVRPINLTIPKDFSIQFIATGIFSDGTIRDLTNKVTWTSSKSKVASISNETGNQGIATGIEAGETVIKASSKGISGSTILTVTNAKLTSIQVTPIDPVIEQGTSIQFSAIGIYSDGTNQDLTEVVTWNSSDQIVAQISNALNSKGQATGLNPGSSTITGTLGEISGTTLLTINNGILTSIQVTPIDSSIEKGTAIQFSATGIYSDMSTQDLTGIVTWNSSNQAVAQISNVAGNKGAATGLSPGSTMITATLGLISDSTLLMVKNAVLTSIQVTPIDPSIAKGTSIQFIATGIYSDGSNQDITKAVIWRSSDEAVAQISDTAGSKGQATGLSHGSSRIIATLGDLSGSSLLNVTNATLTSIQVTPIDPSIAKGTSIQFTATGTYTDMSTQNLTQTVTWSSSNETVAQISDTAGSKGQATGLNPGLTIITATLGLISDATSLTITNATLTFIQITPIDPSIAKGTSIQFTATGTYTDMSTQNLTGTVTWSSSDETVAQISDTAGSKGQTTGLNPGSTTITAALGLISDATSLTVTNATLASIQITPIDPSIAKGSSIQFTATGTYTDMSTQNLTEAVTWSSSNQAVAQISNATDSKGQATGVDIGSSTITAALGLISDTTSLRVKNASLSSIQITPIDPSIAEGISIQFTATGIYTDMSTQNLTEAVTWSSSNQAVAQISNATDSKGQATGVDIGSSTITAALGLISNATSLTVTNATLASIQITPIDPSIAEGTSIQFTATGIYTDMSTQNLTEAATWSSSDQAVAQISNATGSKGQATGVDIGSSTITATLGNLSDNTSLTVTNATLAFIQIAPIDPSIAEGTSIQFTATGIYTDMSTQNLTETVTWSSSNQAVAQISSTAGSKGQATGLDIGSSTITAALGLISDTTSLTVTNATLASIQITPIDPSIAEGTSIQFTATGIYTDMSTQNLTEAVTWTSSDQAVAQISSAAGSKGQATGLDIGSSTITATLGDLSGDTSLMVTSAVLASIQVTPANPSIAKGTSIQFTAIGTYTDMSTQDITEIVTWSSSDQAVAQISNAAGSKGQATGLNIGSTEIIATLNGASGSTSLTVAILESISITPYNPSVNVDKTIQFKATGVLNNATTQDLTQNVTWTSSNTAVAQISDAAGSKGLATGITVGQTEIEANYQGVLTSTTLTVECPSITIVQYTPYGTCVGTGFSYQFATSGDLPAVLFEITSGSLPPGLSLNPSNGVVSGTPGGFQSPSGVKYNFTIRAINKCGSSDSKATSITVYPSNYC